MFPYASLFQWDVGKFTDSYRMLSVDLGIERIRHSFWYVTKASRNVWASWQGTLVTLFCTYAVMRLVGVYDDSKRIFRLWNTSYWTRSELLARHMGIDCLALIAVLMFPRYVQIDILPNVIDIITGWRLSRSRTISWFSRFALWLFNLSLLCWSQRFVSEGSSTHYGRKYSLHQGHFWTWNWLVVSCYSVLEEAALGKWY